MLNHEDLKWIASTSTELNSILQQISRYADLARRHKGQHNYIDLLEERVELASKTAQALFDRVTSNILANTTTRKAGSLNGPHMPFTVLPPPPRVGTTAGTNVKTAAKVEEKSKTKLSRDTSSGPSEIPADIK